MALFTPNEPGEKYLVSFFDTGTMYPVGLRDSNADSDSEEAERVSVVRD